jgi:hypothetical protein
LTGHAAASAIASEIDLNLGSLVNIHQTCTPTGKTLPAGAGALVEFTRKSAIAHRHH